MRGPGSVLSSVLWADYAANEVASRRSAVGPTMWKAG